MRIMLIGADGKMGREVLRLIEERSEESECVAKVDRFSSDDGFFSSPFDFCGHADVLVDFSHPSATEELLNFVKERKIPLVIATTGQNERER